MLLVGTGGAVRLTSSGLGCPTWPKCTADSLVNTPEMGIHGVIEFGNRAARRRARPSSRSSRSCQVVQALRARAATCSGSRSSPASASRPGGPRRHQRPDRPEPVRRRPALRAVDRPGRADARRSWCASTPSPVPGCARAGLVRRRRLGHERRRRGHDPRRASSPPAPGPHAGDAKTPAQRAEPGDPGARARDPGLRHLRADPRARRRRRCAYRHDAGAPLHAAPARRRGRADRRRPHPGEHRTARASSSAST